MDAPRNPYYEKFGWPPAGCFDHLDIWTFGKGVESLEGRMQRYGRGSEGPPLSPKSRLVHIALEEPPASPTTVLDRAPIYGMEEGEEFQYSGNAHDGMLRMRPSAH